MQTSVLDLMWQALQADLARVREGLEVTTARTERSETAGGVKACLFAELPNAAGGAAAGDLFFCTNARKVGEGAGAGTGVLVYYNVATDTWYRASDDSAVVL